MNEPKMFYRGFVMHLIADWILQNDWMANHKVNLNHPAPWTHGAIQLVAMRRVFSFPVALALAIVHLLIDTRKPLVWWRRVYRQTTIEMHEYAGWHVAIWGDQVVHIVCIALAAWWENK